MNRAAVMGVLLLACSAQAQDAGAWWGALEAGVSTSPINPMSSYARPNNIIGFWHCKNSGGVGVQRTNTGAFSNVWNDISGNARNLGLSGFLWDASSGWGNDGALVFDGVRGNANGTLSGLNTNATIMAVVKKRTGNNQMVIETSPNWNNYIGSLGIVYTSDSDMQYVMRTTGYAISPLSGRTTTNIHCIGGITLASTNTTVRLHRAFFNDTIGAIPGANISGQLYNGNFWVGSRAGSSLFLNGDIYMLAIWDATLSYEEWTNNVAVARQQFGF